MHGQDDQGHQGGHQDLVHRVGLVGVADGPGREARAQVAEDPRRHGDSQEGGHAEGNQQPPRVAPHPPVQRAGDHEPGQAGRVAQAVEPGQPRGVVGRLGVERAPAASGGRVADGAGFGVGGRIEPRLGAAAAGGVGVLPGLDPYHPDPVGGLEVEVDRSELFDPPGGDDRDHLGVGVVPRLMGPGLADDPPFVLGQEPVERVAQGGVGRHRTVGLVER